jgi:hypothetical protein
VLQNGQLILVIANLVQQPLYQPRLDFGFGHANRPHNRLLELVAAHAGDQVKALIDALRQIAKARALSQKIGPHRNHDVDGNITLRRRFQQKFDIIGRFSLCSACKPWIAGGCTQIAKQFLELIGNHQNVRARLQPALFHGLLQSQGTTAQSCFGRCPMERMFLREGTGQIAGRIGPRRGSYHIPARADFAQITGAESRD